MCCALRAAWKDLGDLPVDEAKLQYIGLVKSACPDFQEAQAGKAKGGGPGGPVFSSLAEGPEDTQAGPVSCFRSRPTYEVPARGLLQIAPGEGNWPGGLHASN